MSSFVEILDFGDDPKVSETASAAESVEVSSKKLEANRRNAQRSTGPRTEAGKDRSRRNAFKHGILASALLNTGSEDAAAFDEFLIALQRDLAPVGILEETLVERIAICHWRHRRALLCEGGLVKRRRIVEFDPVLWDALKCIPSSPDEYESFEDHYSLPDAPDLDRILRYETAIHRQLVYAINQLERLQRARQGEHVPAPVALHVSSDH